MALEGSDYTMSWEAGDNDLGYWTCRHCGEEVSDYSTEDD